MLFCDQLHVSGWYRECSVIPHTHDFDFAAFREEYSEDLERFLRQSAHPHNKFRLKFVYGRLHDSREDTIETDEGRIDLFYMYPDKGHNYITELGFGRLQQLRFYYPKIEELCTGDLHGRLMFVPCNALKVIKVCLEVCLYGNNFPAEYDCTVDTFRPNTANDGTKTFRRTSLTTTLRMW